MLTTSQRITPKKQKLIDNFLKSKIQVGERIVGLVKSWSNEEKRLI